MLWFNGVAWNDLALAAVACVSVTGVWVTFWPGHRERLRQIRQRRLEDIRKVNHQVQHIGDWAAARPPDLHDPEWYNAAWAVRAFELDDVEQFNQVVIAGDYRQDLTEALVGLELAAQSFHRTLADQRNYLSTAPHDIGLRWPLVRAASQAKGSALSAEDLEGISGLNDQHRAWLRTLYERNRSTHVVAIGGRGGSGLHEAWRRASEAVVAERTWLQSGKEPRWRWAGHLTALIFAALGLLFLIDFTVSFVSDRFRDAPKSPASSTESPSGASVNSPDSASIDSASVSSDSLGNASDSVQGPAPPAASARTTPAAQTGP